MTSLKLPYPKPRMLRTLLIPLLLAFAVASLSTGAEKDSKPGIKGYNCLFMGHSFFAPIAKEFAAHPARCGVQGHKQTIVFHGGERGSPAMLWKDTGADMVAARKLIQTGAVDLLGLTCFDTGSELADYRRWVDFAQKYNRNTRFIIQAPWPRYQNRTISEYEAAEEKVLADVHQRIDQLRKAYPGTVFLSIPQGRWMVGLWRLFEKGELPEIPGVMKAGDPRYLLTDTLGHGGKLPVETGSLLWLAVIYQVDLTKYDWDTHTQSNIKKMAEQICLDDPYCGLAPMPPTKTVGGDGG